MILPRVQPPFAWIATAAGPALVCRAIEPWARHLFTTSSWVLGRPSEGAGAPAPWHQVSSEFSGAFLFRLRQVHGTRAVRAEAPTAQPPEADIVVTDHRHALLAVQAADCVPLLLADRRTGAVAAAHAGWRGMALRVPRSAIAAMRREFSTRADDLLVAAGPSIGACCYEVGGEVRDAFAAAGFSADALDQWFREEPQPSPANPSMQLGPRRPDHWFFDGWTCVRQSLEAEGVPPLQIFLANLCTASHPDVLPSYRRDGSKAGRIAGAITPRRP